MKLVVGLGNPGPEYEWTRHNIGFEVLNLLARRRQLLFHPGRKLDGFEGPAPFEYALHPAVNGGGALLIKPLTFMNRSGVAVAALARQLQVPPAQIMVVTDDLDLPFGKLRLRAQGGPGTHNGMRSILDSLASDQFPRLRVGIGQAGTDAARYVLARFRPEEQADIEITAAQAADAIEAWIAGEELVPLMTRVHSR